MPPVTATMAPLAFDSEFLHIEEAARRYGRTRRTLDRLVARGLLHRYRSPGDKRIYLKIEELDTVLRPQMEDRPDA